MFVLVGSDSPLPRPVATFEARPLLDLTEDERAELVRLLREAIDAEPYRVGPRMAKLKRLLAKLEPPVEEQQTTVFSPRRPSGEPSLVYRKLRGGGRW